MKFKKIAALFTALAVTMGSVTAFAADNTAGAESQRLQGQDRYETAANVADAGWHNGSDYVVIANGEDFADALCSIPLAKKYNAPVLLTLHNSLPAYTESELEKLRVKHIIIVGGEGAVSADIQKAIQAHVSSKPDIRRIWGRDRFETSVKVAEELGNSSSMFLAYGYNYADALSVSSIAAIKGIPILLTDKNSLPQSVESFIEKSKPTNSYIIGLEGAVSRSVEETVNRLTVHPIARLGGIDRYETNIAVLRQFEADFNFTNVFVATGNGSTGNEFADALSGAALAAQKGAPLILAYQKLPTATENYLKSKLKENSVILAIGGRAVLPDDIVNAIVKHIEEKKNQNSPAPASPASSGNSSRSGSDRDRGGNGGSGDSNYQYGSNPVVKVSNGSVSVIYSDSSIQDGTAVTIAICVKGTQNYRDIDQGKFVSGKCEFDVTLESGTYEGRMKVNGKDSIITLPEFTVK